MNRRAFPCWSRAPRRLACGRHWLPGILVIATAITGCEQVPGPAPNLPVDSVRDARPGTAAGADSKGTAAAAANNAASQHSNRVEHWAACFVQGNQVGFTHLTTERVDVDGQLCRKYRYDDELKMKRFQDTTVVRTNLECLEDPTGRLLRFRSEVQTGPTAMITDGVVEQDQLRMELHTAGRSESRSIEWNSRWGGFFADHLSLAEQPMKPRETRRLNALLPILHQVGEIRLEAVGFESVRLLEGTRQLLRIDVTTVAGATQLRSIVWCDDGGQVWKTRDLQLNLEAFRCDRETALRPTSGDGFDLGAGTVVRLEKPLPQPRQTTRAVYLARLTEGDILPMFVQDGSQSIQPLDDGAVALTVLSIRPERPASFPDSAWAEPTRADREPTSLIQSNDPRVVEMASRVASEETNLWKLACELERLVKRSVQLKNYSTAMATAAEVAKSLEGDCTEHAMLLAALCRARKIPARVAIGLVYYPPAQGFAYHMWTEVWINDRWIGLDATLGDGGIGADHLKLAVSSMDGSTAFGDMLPIVQVIGRLKLAMQSVEH
ncbi:MAG: transglutaminase family protein [Pirellulaceae bacterium]|nr:transglutaminase family protein [Pirellulaceae bacterium]